VRELSPEKGGTIPAIAVTANARADDRVRALSAGFQLHMAKPIDPAALTTVIAQMIGDRSA
jgi:CheY-like chemotaxis protein